MNTRTRGAQVEAIARFSSDNGVDLRTVELDVQSPPYLAPYFAQKLQWMRSPCSTPASAAKCCIGSGGRIC